MSHVETAFKAVKSTLNNRTLMEHFSGTQVRVCSGACWRSHTADGCSFKEGNTSSTSDAASHLAHTFLLPYHLPSTTNSPFQVLWNLSKFLSNFFLKISSWLRASDCGSSSGLQEYLFLWATQVRNLQCHAPSCHGTLCLAQCQLDSSMPQVPGAGLLHLLSLFTVTENLQLGQAQVDSSIHSEDVPPD